MGQQTSVPTGSSQYFSHYTDWANSTLPAIPKTNVEVSRSQWPRDLRRRFAAACLLRLWVRIQPWAWMSVRCECCVLSGRGLCGELITRPEDSYRLWCVVMCDLEISRMRRPWPALGSSAMRKRKCVCVVISKCAPCYLHYLIECYLEKVESCPNFTRLFKNFLVLTFHPCLLQCCILILEFQLKFYDHFSVPRSVIHGISISFFFSSLP